MRKIIDYIVMGMREIMEFVEKGYELYGNPFYVQNDGHQNDVYQAMVKYESINIDDGWISVEDILPKNNERVLLYAENYCWIGNSGEDYYEPLQGVTHWRYIPPPPTHRGKNEAKNNDAE